ncbi:MAG: RimK/LysX family protein [Candidatus Microsaccharimonas sp.]|jgi:hypothetical protein
MDNTLPVIGSNALIEIVGHVKGVPAKVDTGADSSAIWASDIAVSQKGVLSFKLFGKSSPYYTGEVITRKSFRVASVRSSNGHTQIRYRVELPIRIGTKRLRASFYLADRSVHNFPILLGRRTLNKKFLVDVSLKEYVRPPKTSFALNKEMLADPYKFHKKYHQK